MTPQSHSHQWLHWISSSGPYGPGHLHGPRVPRRISRLTVRLLVLFLGAVRHVEPLSGRGRCQCPGNPQNGRQRSCANEPETPPTPSTPGPSHPAPHTAHPPQPDNHDTQPSTPPDGSSSHANPSQECPIPLPAERSEGRNLHHLREIRSTPLRAIPNVRGETKGE
ncbi:hypothetical protein Henu3_gp112 [Mycobacterium phage Henu3 PeY-2017]|nr:hypothetical protein Henu3_gp112 [Mycobacterium phage Henu3 PeY-2017]